MTAKEEIDQLLKAHDAHEAEIARLELRVVELTAQVEAARKDGWLPIESAPKDGTRILALWSDECAASAIWHNHDQGGNWYTDIGFSKLIEPTHWMPLPETKEGQI